MIVYDAKNWLDVLWRKSGSVFPRTAKFSLPVSIIAAILKYLDMYVFINFSEVMDIGPSGYTTFAFVLGFTLVFRTNQCYVRFWTCAQCACSMRAQFLECASSLITFSQTSTKSKEDTADFKRKVVCLFSFLHALCLANCACLANEEFPVLGLAALDPWLIVELKKLDDQMRVETVYSWINNLMVHNMGTILNVPAPIITRSFQELEKGQIEYQQILQIMFVPFPFPYTQVTITLLIAYILVTPLVMVSMTSSIAFACVGTFIASSSMLALEIIAAELEYPFGDDDNDLPLHEFHKQLNHSLQILMSPLSEHIPEFAAAEPEFCIMRTSSSFKGFTIQDAPQQAITKEGRPMTSSSTEFTEHTEETSTINF